MTSSRTSLARPLRLLVVAVLATAGMLVPAGTASAADTATPVLNSFSLSDTSVSPGQQVTFSYVATEGAGSLSRLRFEYSDGIHRDIFTFAGPLPVEGSVTMTIPDTWWDDNFYLTWVELSDPSGNNIDFYPSGKASSYPAGAIGPSSHTLPFSPSDLKVAGSTADSTIPALTSISVSGTPASPGQTISGHYEVTDTSGSLKSIELEFRGPFNSTRTLSAPETGPVPLSGVIELVIPETWPNGTYLLNSVRLADAYGTIGDYSANGRVFVATRNAKGPSSHTVNFAPATFNVSGSTADFTPPTLTSLRLTGSPMAPGATATLSYMAQSQDPLTIVWFVFGDPAGNRIGIGGPTTQLTGTLAVTIPVTRPSGIYTLMDVSLRDSAGNTITYSRNGTTLHDPGQAPGKHAFALKALDVTVGTPPIAPTMSGARTRSASAHVFWGNGNGQGALPVSRYTITAQPGGRTAIFAGSATDGEITGLTNDTTYRFTVTATNALGTGKASRQSNPVTPRMSTNILGKDFTGDGRSDLIGSKSWNFLDPLGAYLYRGNGLGGFASGGRRLSGNLEAPKVISPGDFTGDAKNDVMTIESGSLRVQRGNSAGGFIFEGAVVGTGWDSMRSVFGPGDFSGDGKADLMAVNVAGDLYLHRGNGRSGIAGAGQKIGQGWGGFLTVFSPGDFTGDGKSDVMAVSKGGSLYLFRGNGLGRFAAAGQKIGSGWGGFLSVFSPGDFSGDRRSDVMAVTPAGDLLLFRGNGRGGWASGARKIGNGWDAFR
jgi:FG-GAP-like repeat